MDDFTKLTGDALKKALCKHFSYLSNNDEWEDILEAIFQKALSAIWNDGNLEVSFSDEKKLIASPPANKDKYSKWPDSFKKLICIHEEISFPNEDWGLHLGESYNFEQDDFDGEIATFSKEGVTLFVPITDYSDWWVYDPDIKNENGEPILSLLDHNSCNLGKQLTCQAGELFLFRLSQELGLDVKLPKLPKVAPQKESKVAKWWSSLDQDWKDLIADRLELSENQIPNERKINSVTDFIISRNSSVQNLQPLQYFKNLESLFLRNKQIVDISIVNKLPHLEELTIKCDNIDNFQVLSKLSQLKELVISCPKFSEFNILPKLSELEELTLEKMKLESLDEISCLKKLKSLQIIAEDLDSIAPLTKLENLRFLTLRRNKIPEDEIDKLKNLRPKLTVLYVY